VAERFGIDPTTIPERWSMGWIVGAMDYCRIREAQEARLEKLRMSVRRPG